MLEGVSLDQLKAFVTTVDEGSISAAARKFMRSQSAVSEMISNLEAQLGVTLFDRTGRYPRLTAAGVLLIGDARTVLAQLSALKGRAKGIAAGLEPELAVVMDVFFPIDAVTAMARQFRKQFPATPLRLYMEALGGACQPVLDGRCSLGIIVSQPQAPSTLISRRLGGIKMAIVAAADHPLAAFPGVIPRSELIRHVQLVLTDRSLLSKDRDYGVMSPLSWRLGDVFAKQAFLLNGLGWGSMPFHIIKEDIASGRLVVLKIEDKPEDTFILPVAAVYPTDGLPGPAGRWLIDCVSQFAGAAPDFLFD